MKKKLPLKIWLIAAMLLLIAVVHVIMGLTGHGYQWIWIILCSVMAVLYPILEMALLKANEQEAGRARKANADKVVKPTEHVSDGFGDHIQEEVDEGLELEEAEEEGRK